VDKGIATLLMSFIQANKDHMICKSKGTNPELEQKMGASFHKLMAQLPFNEQKLPGGGMAFSSIHRD
jgi:hypothetical protein